MNEFSKDALYETDRKQITLRMPETMKWDLDREAYRKGISLNAFILLLLEEGLSRREAVRKSEPPVS